MRNRGRQHPGLTDGYAQELRYPESRGDPPDPSDVTDALTSVTELVTARDGRIRLLQGR